MNILPRCTLLVFLFFQATEAMNENSAFKPLCSLTKLATKAVLGHLTTNHEMVIKIADTNYCPAEVSELIHHEIHNQQMVELNRYFHSISQILSGNTRRITSLNIDLIGDFIITGSEDKTAVIYDRHNGQCIYTLHEHASPVTAVAINFTKHRALTGCEDGSVNVWKLKKNKAIRYQQCESMTKKIVDLHIYPDAEFLRSVDNHRETHWVGHCKQ